MRSILSFFDRKKKNSPNVNYIKLDETDSTSTYISQHLAEIEAERADLVVVSTEFQTAGRGQGTNRWESERGKNLLFSILCHPVWVPLHAQFLISEAMALTLHDVLSQYTEGITIKWPNDIYWNDKKISGTIIENSLSQGHIRNCIIGTGIDVNQRAFHSDAPNPVSLYQILGKETDREALLKKIVEVFQSYLLDLRNGNYEKIVSLYTSYLFRGHGYFKYRDKDGEFEAAMVEVEDDGHLILHDREGHIRSYAFKEVEFVLFP